ncbi:MAG: sigma-54-dependent Fis family transcriptional regulator [Desulfosarcina sp.]|nr:sigma-54-dependent Fis family transcriptional regulator [Desulfobacterales bacterium]
MESILIVDDEKNYTAVLSVVLEEEGYETLTANSALEALEILKIEDVDLVITDMKMPGMDGLKLLGQIKQKWPDIPVIMMTAHGTVDKAVEAMQKGAYTFILKPFDNERLVIYSQKAIELYRVVKENRRLQTEVVSRYSFDNIIGKSTRMQTAFKTIRRVGPSSATVLIEGESGTGKELVAKSIHFNSSRRERAIVPVNCAALSAHLLESELFGHEKGAFTGAVARKKGRFEIADGGTIFLDEIGEIPPNLQVKLLRVLQEKVIERVGGVEPIPLDIRVIAATNRSLKAEIEKNRFREDLYYRLNVVNITLPPLRQRAEDIRLLSTHFIKKYAPERKTGKPITGFDAVVERLFLNYSWPGNVRELENIIERAMVMCPNETITIEDLPREFRNQINNTLHVDGIAVDARLYETLALVERRMIERAMKMADNVQTRAAEILGIGKSGLNQKLKKYKLDLN